uniref:Uncharacterized protein n=1 Tax=Staphylothermus marinus TaxID=2280 RepID=A0A7C4NPE4_STAMA
MPINMKIVVPIVVVVVVIVALAALLVLRPGGLGGGVGAPGGGGATGTATETTQTETTTGGGTGGTVRAGLSIDHATIPNVKWRNETGILIVEIRNIKVTGYGKLYGNATVNIKAGGESKSFHTNYSQTPITIGGVYYISITVRIEDEKFAGKVVSEFKGIDIFLYYEDPETGSCKHIIGAWTARDLGLEEETTTPIRTRPGGGGPEPW